MWRDSPVIRELSSLAEDLVKAMPVARVLLTGGAVRDCLAGRSPKDYDLTVTGVPTAELRGTLNRLYSGLIHEQGKQFPVFVVGRASGLSVEMAPGRTHDDRNVCDRPDLQFLDLARRVDYSINGMGLDLMSKELVDPLGGGRDLVDRILRLMCPARLVEDPPLILRGIQFAARFQLNPDPETARSIHDAVSAGVLDDCDSVRIRTELTKLLCMAIKPSHGLEVASSLGVLEVILPEVQAVRGVPHDPRHHPEGDVWCHTMKVIDKAAYLLQGSEALFTERQRLTIMLAALFHDCGKTITTKITPHKISSPGHEHHSAKLACGRLRHLGFSRDIQRAVCCMVAHHMRPADMLRALEQGEIDERQYCNHARRLVRDVFPATSRQFLLLTEADWRGRGVSETQDRYEAGARLRRVIDDAGFDGNPQAKLLQGADIQSLGITDSRIIGLIIRDIEAKRDRGAVETAEQARLLVKLRHWGTGQDLDELGYSPQERAETAPMLRAAIIEGTVTSREQAIGFLVRAKLSKSQAHHA